MEALSYPRNNRTAKLHIYIEQQTNPLRKKSRFYEILTKQLHHSLPLKEPSKCNKPAIYHLKRGKYTFSKFRFNDPQISSRPHFRYTPQTLNLYIFILNILILLLLIPQKIDSNSPDLFIRYRKEGHLEAKSIGFRLQKLCF